MTEPLTPTTGRSDTRRRLLDLLGRRSARLLFGLVIPLLIAVREMVELRRYTIDDAYISFRYARNLVEGHGLVYNVGEYVEGYTNFAWTLLIAVGLEFGVAPEAFVNALGLTFGVATFVFTYIVAERLAPAGPVPCIATWLLASTAIFNGHAVFGFETAMFAGHLMAGSARFLVESQDEKRYPWSGLLFAFAALTRPEAPLFFGLLLLHLAGPPLLPSKRLARFGRRLFGGDRDQWRPAMTGLSMALVASGTMLVQRDVFHDDDASGALALGGSLLMGSAQVRTGARALVAVATLAIAVFVLPAQSVAMSWRQANVVAENLRWLSLSGQPARSARAELDATGLARL